MAPGASIACFLTSATLGLVKHPPDLTSEGSRGPAYDSFADQYAELLAQGQPVIEIAHAFALDNLGSAARGRVLDLGCGTGELTRRLAQGGAAVTAVDISDAMLRIAEGQGGAAISYLKDDIQSLSRLPSGSWDLAVACLCLMDLPDQAAVFQAAARVLVVGGEMVWTILHPCFQSPFSEARADDLGFISERLVREYRAAQWRSSRPGTVRGQVGAHHRPVADYLNSFVGAGFHIERVAEPLVPASARLAPDRESHRALPPIFGVVGSKQ
jgi:SAM-dependent methyltransferase